MKPTSEPQQRARDSSLQPIPEFPHDSMEPAVRAQFAQARAKLDQDQTNAQANGEYGMLFHAYDMAALAEACYRRALATAEAGTAVAADWSYLLGVVLAEQGENAEASRMFHAVLESRPADIAATYMLAELNRSSGETDEALRGYRRAIELSPNHAHAHCGAAHVLVQMGKLDDAEAHARKAIELAEIEGRGFARAHYVLGQVLREQNQIEQAKSEFALSEVQRDREPSLLDPLMLNVQQRATGTVDAMRQGIDLMLEGQVDRAIPLLEKAVELHPDFAEAHGQLGAALLVKGELERAAAALRRAIDLNPTYTDALYNLGQLEYQRGRAQEATDLFTRAVQLQPEYVEAQRGLGTVLPLLGRDEEAMDHLRKAIALRPRDGRPYTQLAELLERHDHDAEAVAVLRDGVARIPHDYSIRERLAWMLASSPVDSVRDSEEALRMAAGICQKSDHPKPLATLAAAQAAGGQFDEALQTARRSLAGARSLEDRKLIAIVEWMIQGLESGHALHELPPLTEAGSKAPRSGF